MIAFNKPLCGSGWCGKAYVQNSGVLPDPMASHLRFRTSNLILLWRPPAGSGAVVGGEAVTWR